jgi:hypothetical protein
MNLLFKGIRKLVSVILFSSKDTGKFKIAMYREISNSGGVYRFGFIIESEP